MAIHVAAEIVPGKLELLQAWVPNQPWLGRADASVLPRLGSYRFDDPDGEVGMERSCSAPLTAQSSRFR